MAHREKSVYMEWKLKLYVWFSKKDTTPLPERRSLRCTSYE